MGSKSRLSTNPEDYIWTDVAQKTDSDGKRYWTAKGPLIVSREVDTQKEATDHEDVWKTAWEWFQSGRTFVDINHSYKPTDVIPVESYVSEKGDEGNHTVSWMVRVITYNPTIGQKMDRGELNAFSWAGPVDREAYATMVKHPLEASGTTEKSDHGPYPEHDHPIEALKFDDDAKVVPTRTGIAFGHQHDIVGTTRTEPRDGHAHGMLIEGGQ